ncbi:N-acetylgalactosamine-N,N'-diacetylbacillosaminyl-diphospho-undecaprenol 4-alpha-N-acetylgalactosaminyltransferase [subsurface metagenome]
MNYFYYPEDSSKLTTFFLKLLVPLAARRSDKIITVSRNSKKDIVQILKIPEGKICVIYEAGSSRLSLPTAIKNKVRNKLKERDGINKKFILTVSASHPHKNLYRLIEAYDILYKRYQIDCQLVIVGIKGRAQSVLMSLVKELSLEKRIIFTGWVTNEDLSWLYSQAELFVFPSLFEGFGIPVLEAMAHGAPVVSSNVASLPEVVGDAALLVDPYSVDEIAEAMYRVLTDKNLRKDLIEKGSERVHHFSWEKTARETLSAYKKACGKE